jgi:predicted MPP superfamily phosphohydrolase
MNTIIFGDIHGLPYWQQIVAENSLSNFVFLGDYLDPYLDIPFENLIENLQLIIGIKKERPQNVILLFGNHDLHYITDEITTSTRYNYENEEKIKDVFVKNISLFQYAHQRGNIIFTHAGITNEWFIKDFKGDINKNIAEQLNNSDLKQRAALFQISGYRGGSDKHGGIFWADIIEVCDDPLKNFIQIVGHNKVEQILVHKKNRGEVIFCDCLFNEKYLKI